MFNVTQLFFNMLGGLVVSLILIIPVQADEYCNFLDPTRSKKHYVHVMHNDCVPVVDDAYAPVNLERAIVVKMMQMSAKDVAMQNAIDTLLSHHVGHLNEESTLRALIVSVETKNKIWQEQTLAETLSRVDLIVEELSKNPILKEALIERLKIDPEFENAVIENVKTKILQDEDFIKKVRNEL